MYVELLKGEDGNIHLEIRLWDHMPIGYKIMKQGAWKGLSIVCNNPELFDSVIGETTENTIEMRNIINDGKGHYCYDCDEFFHDSNPYVIKHKGCKTKRGLGICVDRKEFGQYYEGNLREMSKEELIQTILKLTAK